MKKTKILSLILSLCMTVSIFAVGKVGASAVEVAGTQTEVGENIYKDKWEPVGIQTTDDIDDFFSKLYSFAKSQISTMEIYDDYLFTLNHVIATDLGKTADYACVGYFVMKSNKVKRWQDLLGIYNGTQYVKYNGIVPAVVGIHANEKGELKSVNVNTINLDEIKTANPVPSYKDYPWICMAKADEKVENSLSTVVKEALDGYDDLKLSVISELGTKKDSDKDSDIEHRYMCYGTASVEFPNTYIYIVDVLEKDNTAEIKNIQFFDINSYVVSLTTHNENDNAATDPQNTSNNTATDPQKKSNATDDSKTTGNETKINTGSTTNGSSGKMYDNTNNANGSIATGQNSIAATIALVLIVMLPVVLLFFRRRKKN